MFEDILTMASKPVGGERAKRVRPEESTLSFTQMYRSLRLKYQNQFESPVWYCGFLTKRVDIQYNGASPLNYFLESSRSITVLHSLHVPSDVISLLLNLAVIHFNIINFFYIEISHFSFCRASKRSTA